MDLLTLCDAIDLQPEVKGQVLAFGARFDFGTVAKQLRGFYDYEAMKQARLELQTILGEDEDHLKMLACMLKASADAYGVYREKGIGDEVYFATMKCYPRFLAETYQMTGRWYFDRYWWTTRQAGCHLFRLGELEYELESRGEERVIQLHIPSDADFSPAAVDRSLQAAERFLARHYPGFQNCRCCCHSWLLDRQLQNMLGEKSNIRAFQERFRILDEGEVSSEFMEWVFQVRPTDQYGTLPERTSLQRSIKSHLLSGGVIREAYGQIC